MEITVAPSDDEVAAMRRLAERQGVSVDELVSRAVDEHLNARPARLHAAVDRVVEEDSELLGRLAR